MASTRASGRSNSIARGAGPGPAGGGRRAWWALAAGAAAVALTASGCAGSAGAAKSGDLRVALETQPDCLDPAVSALDVTAVVDRGIFDSLVDLAPDGTFKPWLAQSWDVSPDGLTYTFHLRTGVVFQDGTPLDAAAVKASLDHVVDPATKSKYAAGLIRQYAGATVVDPTTVKIALKAPQAAFLQALSSVYLGIQSPTSIAQNAANLCVQPVGSGPFRFTSWVKNQSVELKKNPAYQWGPADAQHTGPARVDGITMTFVAEPSVRFGALTSGQADVVLGVPPDRAGSLQGGEQLLRADAPGIGYTLFLNPERAPFDDERVRQAFAQSLDLDSLVKSVYFGQFKRAWSVLGPTSLGYDKALEGAVPYDPAAANRLLDQAGWTQRDSAGYRVKDGKRLTVHFPYATQMLREQRDVLGQGIQAQAKNVGIDVDFSAVDLGTYTNDVLAADLDINGISNVRADPDVLRTFFASDQTPQQAGGNIFHISDPQLDALLNQAAATSDTAQRVTLYQQAQQYISDHMLAVPVYTPAELVGAAKSVKGIVFDAADFPRFYDVTRTGS